MPKVLIVEDEKLIVKILEKFVEKTIEDCDITVLSTGEDVIGLLEGGKSHFDLVILDYNLPDISCEEIISQIRTHNESTKIVLSTGELAANLSSVIGADGFLQKPFTFKEFRTIVNSLEI